MRTPRLAISGIQRGKVREMGATRQLGCLRGADRSCDQPVCPPLAGTPPTPRADALGSNRFFLHRGFEWHALHDQKKRGTRPRFLWSLAEGVGFEPTVGQAPHLISRGDAERICALLANNLQRLGMWHCGAMCGVRCIVVHHSCTMKLRSSAEYAPSSSRPSRPVLIPPPQAHILLPARRNALQQSDPVAGQELPARNPCAR